MKILAKNKKAFAEYEVLEKFEAGIKLNGSEVKSCRTSNVNLKGSYVAVQAAPRTPQSGRRTQSTRQPSPKLFLKEAHISRYKFSQIQDYNPTRPRELLLNSRELKKIENSLNTQGVTMIPLCLYLKNNLIKLELGLCRGKKKHDRREELKRRAQNRQIDRTLKNFR